MPVIYDFLWDDQGSAGVWVRPPDGGNDVLVEASVLDGEADETGYHEPLAEYVLASDIKLKAGDGVWTSACSKPVYGAAADAVLRTLVEIETNSKQVAVNRQQVALLGDDAPRTDTALDML